MSNPTARTTQNTKDGSGSNTLSAPIQTQNERALSENLISKDEVETLSAFQSKVDRAKMENVAADSKEPAWVETSEAICKYFCRAGLGKAGYFDYQGVRVCPYGQAAGLMEGLKVQLGTLIYGKDEARVNQITAVKPQAVR